VLAFVVGVRVNVEFDDRADIKLKFETSVWLMAFGIEENDKTEVILNDKIVEIKFEITKLIFSSTLFSLTLKNMSLLMVVKFSKYEFENTFDLDLVLVVVPRLKNDSRSGVIDS